MKWEYFVLPVHFIGEDLDCGKIEQELDKLGAEGWEVVGALNFNKDSRAIILKRPK
jgi:hypothetical protein